MTGWILSLQPSEFWFYSLLWWALCLYSGWRACSALHKKRTITGTPTSWLRSAAQGYTELIGRGVHMDGAKLASPLSGRECLWYRIETEDLGESVDSIGAHGFDLISLLRLFSRSTVLRAVNAQESDDLFYLDDDTGLCVIDPEGAQITPSLSRNWYGNSPVPDRGPALSGTRFGNRYRYTEELLLPGDILYAIGDLKTVGGAGCVADRQEEVRALLNDWKQDQHTLLQRFDRNKDGHIDEPEWDHARASAIQTINQKHACNDVPPVVTLLKNTADLRRPYLISSEPLHDLVNRYQRHALCFFLISLLACSVLVWSYSIRL